MFRRFFLRLLRRGCASDNKPLLLLPPSTKTPFLPPHCQYDRSAAEWNTVLDRIFNFGLGASGMGVGIYFNMKDSKETTQNEILTLLEEEKAQNEKEKKEKKKEKEKKEKEKREKKEKKEKEKKEKEEKEKEKQEKEKEEKEQKEKEKQEKEKEKDDSGGNNGLLVATTVLGLFLIFGISK